ncbi:MAG TPA: nucleotidyltransferase domain-containing protein [Phycisphaerae bacterium]|nr:nucleotidyltransferase domain-containing protein [Phycisphaerae bacterium]
MKVPAAVDDAVIQEIVQRILKVTRPRRIILFGSAATGGMTSDSDIDLLVLEDSPGNVRQKSVRLRESLGAMGYPFDVIVMATDRFEETRDLVGGIARPASRHGRIIYEAA